MPLATRRCSGGEIARPPIFAIALPLDLKSGIVARHHRCLRQKEATAVTISIPAVSCLPIVQRRRTNSFLRAVGTTEREEIVVFASIVFGGLALALSFVVSSKAGEFGPAVAARFLERGGTIRPGDRPLTATELQSWISDPKHRDQVKGYVRAVLPLDVLFLISMGSFLALGSSDLLAGPRLPGWAFWIVPGAYMAADITEDALIARTLSGGKVEDTFDSMRRTTEWKLRFAVLSFLQLFSCAGYGAWERLVS